MTMRIDPEELDWLAAQYGEPVRWTRTLTVSPDFMENMRKREQKKRGEMVLAIPRPGQRVLVHTKSFYPADAFRLLSGGIELGEPVEEAGKRELREETGLATRLTRWLGYVEYEFQCARDQAHFVSYVFMTGETSDRPQVGDLDEGIAEFREVAWSDLAQVADKLENLPEGWRDWGRFRAVVHRLVVDAIA